MAACIAPEAHALPEPRSHRKGSFEGFMDKVLHRDRHHKDADQHREDKDGHEHEDETSKQPENETTKSKDYLKKKLSWSRRAGPDNPI